MGKAIILTTTKSLTLTESKHNMAAKKVVAPAKKVEAKKAPAKKAVAKKK